VRERGIVVALSGQGGDEVFGGYRSFRAVPRWQRGMKWLNRLAPSFRAALAGAATLYKGTVAQEKASDVAHAGTDFLALYFQFRRLVSNDDLDLLTGSSSKRLDPFLLSPAINPEELIVTGDPEASIRRLETAFYLRNTLLRDGDVFGMANSLEIRVPFLDRDLVDWAFRLPGKIFLPPNAPYKHLLRKMFVDFYTEEMLHQPKRGFTAPFSLWLNGALRNTMEESLATLRDSGLVNPKGVIKIHQAFLNEPKSAAWSRVWGLVALGYWLNRTQSAYLPTT
jgi:asparagine synthase (glutamine-hydrolysing)